MSISSDDLLHMHPAFVVNFFRKEGNVLFCDALNTFYLWLFGVERMVKDNRDSEKEETHTATRAILSD